MSATCAARESADGRRQLRSWSARCDRCSGCPPLDPKRQLASPNLRFRPCRRLDGPNSRAVGEFVPARKPDRFVRMVECSGATLPLRVDARQLRPGAERRRDVRRLHQQPDRHHSLDGDPDHDRRLRRLCLRLDQVPGPRVSCLPSSSGFWWCLCRCRWSLSSGSTKPRA